MPGRNDNPGTPDPADPDDGIELDPGGSAAPSVDPNIAALQNQLRREARARGRAEAAARAAMEREAAALAAAEAERQAAISDQLTAILGESGVDAFNEIAELSETDPAGAARRFRELASQIAQSDPAAAAALVAATNGGANVTQQPGTAQVPPPPSQSLTGDAPLNQPTTGTDWDGIITGAETRYGEIVQRNQDPITRARVTDRERGEGFMSYLAASLVKGMRAVGRLPR